MCGQRPWRPGGMRSPDRSARERCCRVLPREADAATSVWKKHMDVGQHCAPMVCLPRPGPALEANRHPRADFAMPMPSQVGAGWGNARIRGFAAGPFASRRLPDHKDVVCLFCHAAGCMGPSGRVHTSWTIRLHHPLPRRPDGGEVLGSTWHSGLAHWLGKKAGYGGRDGRDAFREHEVIRYCQNARWPR